MLTQCTHDSAMFYTNFHLTSVYINLRLEFMEMTNSLVVVRRILFSRRIQLVLDKERNNKDEKGNIEEKDKPQEALQLLKPYL